MNTESLVSIALGLGLSAACGFRVFVPLLLISAAARYDYLALSPGFAWMESTAALVAFGTATVLEVAAYYVPWLDNFLDAAATPRRSSPASWRAPRSSWRCRRSSAGAWR